MERLKAVRYVLWAVVVAAAVAAAWMMIAPKQAPFATADIGGPFTLIDQKGATVTEAALKGHPSAMFFGYTFCPDVCPTTLSDLTLYMQELGADADRLKVYFVTVDPERDTQATMASYLEAFDPRIVGLTGARPAVDAMLKEYRVYSRKVEGKDGAPYTMDHTATVYLLDSNGQLVGTLDYQEKPEIAMAKLKRLLGA
jgi:protein SCO1/2